MQFEKSLDHLLKGVSSVCADSRLVKPGDLFVCIPCEREIENVAQAIANGASVILGSPKIVSNFSNQIKCVETLNPRLDLSLLAKTYFKTQPETIVAVTGTNGKSSVVSLVQQFWQLLGYKAASLGTLGLEVDANVLSKLPPVPPLTTYDSLSFFKLLKNLAVAEISHVAFEASSHGLDQYRIHGSKLSAAGFTNLTQDHLDYHLTMENYLEAKAKLFTEVLTPGKISVLNANSPYFENIKLMITNPIVSYGVDITADLSATQVRTYAEKVIFNLSYNGETTHDLILNLAGSFQVENLLCAMGLVIGTGTPLADILPLVPLLKSVNGRMEFIGQTSTEADVYVDYAHTPDALERSLKSLREHTKNHIWVLFGCGGDRDKTKRSIMGKVATSFADKVIITDDNPRSEDPATIRQQIIGELNVKEIADRKSAIMYCVAHLAKGDSLLIAGKGHEMGQIIGNTTYPFSDRQHAETAIAGLK